MLVRPRFSALLQSKPLRPASLKPSVITRQLVTNPDNKLPYQRLADEYLQADSESQNQQNDVDCNTPPTELPKELELRQASLQQLGRFRRDFALTNHPDRVPADQRDAATREMARLNRMIDDELTRRR